MSFAFDVNPLIYASDLGSPHHDAARELLEEKANGRELFCIAWTTAMPPYLRIVTHPGVLALLLSPAKAMANLRSLHDLPHVRFLTEKDGFPDAYTEASGGEPVRGKLVPDVHLAAILLQHDVRTLYTNDSDFRRFAFLDVRNPLAA